MWFIEQGFPNRGIEDWKFSDLNQIISANFENLDFSKKNIDKSVDVDFINEFEHNKIIFVDGNISKTDFNHEDKDRFSLKHDFELDEQLNENSKGVYQGKIYVNSKAQKTDGYQLSRALLLNDDVEFNAKPELEIYADDVKCSHGSASGSLSEDSIFYLMSRGLNYQQSRELLINGFLLDVVEKITDSETKNLVKNMIGLKEWI